MPGVRQAGWFWFFMEKVRVKQNFFQMECEVWLHEDGGMNVPKTLSKTQSMDRKAMRADSFRLVAFCRGARRDL